MSNQSNVLQLYTKVVEDVISGVRDAFQDDQVDEQVLQELKSLWDQKLKSSKAAEPPAQVMRGPHLVSGYHTNVGAQVPTATNTIRLATAQPGQVYSTVGGVGVAPTGAVGTVYQQGAITPAAQAAQMAIPTGLYQQHINASGQRTITLQSVPQQYIVQAQNNTTGTTQQQIVSQLDGTTDDHEIHEPSILTETNKVDHDTDNVSVSRQDETDHQQSDEVDDDLVHQLDCTLLEHLAATADNSLIVQLDGQADNSSDENDDDDDDDDDDDKDDDDEEDEAAEEEPLNSGDDVSEEDTSELFSTENVVVCQFDKINRAKNKWKFHLKDGIMNVNGKDMVFHKALGEAEW